MSEMAKQEEQGVAEGYWQDALKKAETGREARKGKSFEKNPASHDKQGVYKGDKDLAGNPVPKRKDKGVVEGTTPGMATLKNSSMAQQDADQKKREAEKAAAQSKAAEKRVMDWAKSKSNEGTKMESKTQKTFSAFRKKVAEEYIKLDEQDLLAMRGLFSTDPGAVPRHMGKTPGGAARVAKRNIEPLKNRISKALGKHPKPNLPEETYVLSDVFGAGIVLTNEHAEPDADGIIDWYAVEFDHGKEKVFVEDLELMAAQYEALIEQIEQIDELSTDLKLRYLRHADQQVKGLRKAAREKQGELNKLPLGGPETEKAVADLSANAGKQINRSIGMAHAVRKLAKSRQKQQS